MKLTNGLRVSGKITIATYRAGMIAAIAPLLRDRSTYRRLGANTSEFDEEIADIKRAHFIRTAVECSNLVMDSPNYGLDLIIQRLVGNNTYSLNLLWIEIGTGTTAPTVNDTSLTTPSVRAAVSFQEDYGATDAIVQAYITDANLPNATYGEVGSFVDGTSTIGTGQLFNHALISPTYTKVSGEDTTIEIDINLTNS
ncbi:MAG TPA: hypothetical protein VKW08_00385 [Xanthobacteraceae bacterium]|nr:hypothetical protein [Xanthobacteraceae bacterium]